MGTCRKMDSSEARLDLYSEEGNFGDEDPVLAGNISVTGTAGQSDGAGGVEFNTLDEPISKTIKRDLSAVGTKFLHVLYPKEKKSLLKEWDLWGPLILCTFMATVLQGHDSVNGSDKADGGPEFAEVFVIVWVGAMVVTLNTKLLGGSISFFQSVCVLGYCLLPLVLSLVVCWVIQLVHQNTVLLVVHLRLHAVSWRLQSPQQENAGSLSYVLVLPCDWMDGDLPRQPVLIGGESPYFLLAEDV